MPATSRACSRCATHVVERRRRRRNGVAGAERLHRLEVRGCRLRPGRRAASTSSRPDRTLRADEVRHEGDHADPAVVGQPGQYVVGNVARMVADGAGRGVAEDHRSGADVERVSHGASAATWERSTSMPSRFISVDDLAAEGGQPAVGRIVGGRVGPVGVLVVGEGEVADAEPVERAQHAEGVVDAVTALGPEQAADRSRPRPGSASSPSAEVTSTRSAAVALHHVVDGVDLLQGRRHRRSPRPSVQGTNTDQNCAPTPPARSRGRSVCS